MSRIATSLIVVAVFALSACEEETEVAESEERVRAIKTFTVTQPAGGQTRSFSGSLAAAATSSLSFSVGGSTTKVNVTAGDSVQAGDVLAELDPEPLMLDVGGVRGRRSGLLRTTRRRRRAASRRRPCPAAALRRPGPGRGQRPARRPRCGPRCLASVGPRPRAQSCRQRAGRACSDGSTPRSYRSCPRHGAGRLHGAARCRAGRSGPRAV